MGFRHELVQESINLPWRQSSLSRGQSATHHFVRPPLSTVLKPTQMATNRGGAHDDVRRCRELVVRHRQVGADWVVFCAYGQDRNLDVQRCIDTARITVVGALSWVSPRGTLHKSIPFPKIC